MKTNQPPALSDTQRKALEDAINILQAAFPGQSGKDIISQQLLPHLLGPLPRHSNLAGYAFNKTTLAAVAANVVCHGIDPDTSEPIVILVSRKEKNPRGQHFRGHIGGYVNLDHVRGKDGLIIDSTRGEQPYEGVMGETDEETRDANNKAIITLSPDRLELLTGGINYQVSPPVAYFAYTSELTGQEIKTLKEHAKRFAEDDVYRANTLMNNDYEVFGIHVIPVAEAKKITADAFLYQAAWMTFQAALKRIDEAFKAEAIRNPIIKTAFDTNAL